MGILAEDLRAYVLNQGAGFWSELYGYSRAMGRLQDPHGGPWSFCHLPGSKHGPPKEGLSFGWPGNNLRSHGVGWLHYSSSCPEDHRETK